jgi:hypothetical protein
MFVNGFSLVPNPAPNKNAFFTRHLWREPTVMANIFLAIDRISDFTVG